MFHPVRGISRAHLVLLFFCCAPVSALEVELDFTGSDFFANNPAARATLEQAAYDVSEAITSSLAPITQYTWSLSEGNQNGRVTTADYTWLFSYQRPSDGTQVTITPILGADIVRIFVLEDSLPGVTLGTGGAAGIGFSAQYSGFPGSPLLESQFDRLIDRQTELATDEFNRGAGPIISTLSGTSTLDFPGPPDPDAAREFSVAYGASFGRLALDVDQDNNGFTDTPQSLAEYWHLDHSTPVGAGRNDLYSVALHEILHVLGFGASQTWQELVNGRNWMGTEVIAEYGSGASLVDGDHIAGNLLSRRISDGAPQEPAMDPDVTVGERKYITELDLAFLRDIGYTTVMSSLVGDCNADGRLSETDLACVGTLSERDAVIAELGTSIGDLDGNGDVSFADFLVLSGNFGRSTASYSEGNIDLQLGVGFTDFLLLTENFGWSPAAVPEPRPLAMLLAACSVGLWSHRKLRSRRKVVLVEDDSRKRNERSSTTIIATRITSIHGSASTVNDRTAIRSLEPTL